MKIAFIGGRDLHELGGIENYMYNLASQLAQKGYEPVVYCESGATRVEWINGYKVIHLKTIRNQFLCKPWHALRATIHCILYEKNVKIIHYNIPLFSPIYSWLPCLRGIHRLFQFHSFAWESPKYTLKQKKLIYYLSRLSCIGIRHCITVNHEKAVFLKKVFHVDSNVIYPGINLPDKGCLLQEDNILRKYDLVADKYLLFIGRLDRIKNIDILIRAFLKAQTSDYKLVIAGKNDADPEYVKYLHYISSGHSNIIFTGAVYHKDKENLLQHCSAICLLSSSEGLPISILEGMAYGKICIISSINGNVEACGEAGIQVSIDSLDDVSAKIQDYISNPEQYNWQKEYNYQRVRTFFQWSVIANQYVKYINSHF